MNLYKSHLNGFLIKEDYGNEYCEICGDSDEYIGEFENSKELAELLLSYLIEVGGSEGVDIESFLDDIKEGINNKEMFISSLNEALKLIYDIAIYIKNYKS